MTQLPQVITEKYKLNNKASHEPEQRTQKMGNQLAKRRIDQRYETSETRLMVFTDTYKKLHILPVGDIDSKKQNTQVSPHPPAEKLIS